MESVIGLHFSTLPSPSVRMPSGFHAARATKPHSRLISHSSLSLPKDPRSLSLGHNSSLSLPQCSGGRPLDHIIGPISCMVDGSLPPPHNRDHRGASNVPWASRSLRNMGRGNRSNHKANVGPRGGPLSSPPSGNDERHQGEQPPDLVKRLLQSQLAVKLQKALEPIVNEKAAYNEIIDMVEVLKKFQNHNLVMELLLKAIELCVKEQQPLSYIRFSIMEILCNQGKYQEASNYWIRLYETDSLQLQKLSPKMQCCILCALCQHEKANEYIQKFIEFKNGSSAISSMPPDQLEEST